MSMRVPLQYINDPEQPGRYVLAISKFDPAHAASRRFATLLARTHFVQRHCLLFACKLASFRVRRR